MISSSSSSVCFLSPVSSQKLFFFDSKAGYLAFLELNILVSLSKLVLSMQMSWFYSFFLLSTAYLRELAPCFFCFLEVSLVSFSFDLSLDLSLEKLLLWLF